MIQWKAYLPERPKFYSKLSLTSFCDILQVTSNKMGLSGKKQILSKCNSSHLTSICVLLSYLWKSATYAQSPKFLKDDLPKKKQTNKQNEKKTRDSRILHNVYEHAFHKNVPISLVGGINNENRRKILTANKLRIFSSKHCWLWVTSAYH